MPGWILCRWFWITILRESRGNYLPQPGCVELKVPKGQFLLPPSFLGPPHSPGDDGGGCTGGGCTGGGGAGVGCTGGGAVLVLMVLPDRESFHCPHHHAPFVDEVPNCDYHAHEDDHGQHEHHGLSMELHIKHVKRGDHCLVSCYFGVFGLWFTHPWWCVENCWCGLLCPLICVVVVL